MKKKEKSGIEEVKEELRKVREEMKEVKNKLTESARSSCLVHLFYFGILAGGLPGGAFFAGGTFDLPFILLYSCAIALWFRFWFYDTRNPGLKCITESVEKIHESIFFLLALIFSFLLAMVFWFASQPLFYMSILTFVYFTKSLWHFYHKRGFEEATENFKTLHLAFLSDLIITVILAIMSIIFLADFFIFPRFSVPSFLHVELASYSFKICMSLFLIVATWGLEIHYIFIERMLLNSGNSPIIQ